MSIPVPSVSAQPTSLPVLLCLRSQPIRLIQTTSVRQDSVHPTRDAVVSTAHTVSPACVGCELRIPAKANARGEAVCEHQLSDAGLLFVGEVFDFVTRNDPERSGGWRSHAGKRGTGNGTGPFPTHQRPAGTTSPVIWHAFFLIEPPFDTVGVVDQAVEDPVGLRRVADLRVATRHRLVRGENRGSGLIPVFADFPEVTTLPFV